MGRHYNDLTGMKFGKLTVIGLYDEVYIEPKNGYRRKKWICQCDCGNITCVVGGELTKEHGGTKSCGCLQKEKHYEAHKKYNQYDLAGEYGIGYCSNTNSEFYFDLEDYDKIKDYCWYEMVDNTGYHMLMARIPSTNKCVKMAHLLGFINYDHIDRNALNNQKNNFRECTKSENAMNRSVFKNNTSGFTGVYFSKRDAVWIAQITFNKNQICIGRFKNKEDAIRARLEAEAKYFKEFAPQKHLFREYGIFDNKDGDINEQ